MKFQRNLKVFTGQLTVAPFAAVTFLILIFLTLNTVLVHTPGVRISLPGSVNDSGPSYPSIAIAMDRAGQLFFEQQAVGLDRLKAKLIMRVRESKSPLTLVVQADAGATYSDLLPISRVAEEAGFRELLWATRPSGATPERTGNPKP